MKHCYWLVALALLAAPAAGAQTSSYTVQGTVTEAGTGEGVPGVNVRIAGTSLGAATDLEGRFAFQAPVRAGEATVEFSAVGYRQLARRVVLGAERTVTLDVALQPDILNLDDVVVTGNSPTATRRQLGTSISVVDGEALSGTATPNPLAALSGKVMGAQIRQNSGDPAGSVSVRLRGASSITGSSDPLYIVDGVIVDNSSQNVINLSGDSQGTGFLAGQNRLVDLNPDDIERIEVLNGAAASAIYGSRASNGVVQIFTKRGRIGRPVLDYSVGLTQSALRKQPFLTTIDRRFGVPGSPRLESTQDRLTTLLTLGLTPAQLDALGARYTVVGGRLLVTETYPVQRYNYWDDIFAPAYGAEQNLSVSGGTDRTRYFVSGSAFTNGGIVRNTAFDKYTGRVRLDQNLASWAELSTGLAYTYSRSRDMPNGNNFFSPVSTVYIIDNVWDINERDANGNLRMVEQVRMNPLSVIETFRLSQTTNRATGNLNLRLYPVPGLTVTSVLGVDTYALEGQEFHPRVPYPGVAATFFPDGYASVAKDNVLLLNGDVSASYDRAVGAAFRSTTTAGYSIQYNQNNYTAQEGRDLAPFVETIRAASNYFSPPQQVLAQRMIAGTFAQQTLGWREQVFVTLAGRVDGSSAFSDANQRQFYPKASASWVASELWAGRALARAVPTFRVRGSYGQAGNLSGIGPYDRYNNYLLSTLGGTPAINPSRTFANPDVKPERMTELEGGFDASFLRSRFGLSLNVYQQRVRDLLLFRPVPPSLGGASIVTNLGDAGTFIQNRGLEVQLNANLVRQAGLVWNVGALYNANRNVVRGIEGVIALRGGDGPQYVISGQPFGVFYGRFYARDEAGNLLMTAQGLRQPERGAVTAAGCSVADQAACAVRVNGQPSGTELRRVLGSPDPDWTGALTTDVAYGRVRLNLLLDGSFGGEIYNWNRITGNNVGHGRLAEQELRGEVPRGTVASVAGGVTGQRIQEEHVEDATFVKLREIGLVYDAGSVGPWFQRVTLGVVGRNLFSFDRYEGFDPETNSAGQSDRVRGDDFGNVPIPRTVQLRFNARF